ncbi:MAG: hypothetical protein D6806_12525 [Deltaproteobacteria bacterium]|nr:MAG: hypothetical protein D6806_12525 [Deltaproteobacteria bacterium]
MLVGLEGAEQARRGFTRLEKVAWEAGIEGRSRVLVQQMVTGGTEMILGAKQDPNFGPVVLAGSGGIFVEVLRDVAIKVAPVSRSDIDDMLRRLKVLPILEGARGRRPRDLEALKLCIDRIARLVVFCPEIRELDVNPLMLLQKGRGALAVDARIVL